MTVTAADAARILAVAAVYDKRTIGPVEADAWAQALDELDARRCAEAVKEHFARCDTGAYLTPAHVRTHVEHPRRPVGELYGQQCDCGGAIHLGHWECEYQCGGGHLFVPGRGWQRCNHNGTTSPYDVPVDQRHVQAAHQAVAEMHDFLDAKQAASGERLEEAG